MSLPLPNLVVHADWSLHPAKRWQAWATRNGRGPFAYTLHAPQPVPHPAAWLEELQRQARPSGSVLLGLDMPLGLPRAYAALTGVDDFLALLPHLGQGPWADFYSVAERPEEISPARPFYPQRPGQARQQHLLDGLNVTHLDDLRRLCDLPANGRRAAAPLFWTLGAQQVGKAAISGWQEVVTPAVEMGAALWPFAGRLADLLHQEQLVIAETYPAECYSHLGVRFPPRTGKRSPDARRANAAILLAWGKAASVALTPALAANIRAGFGPRATGEDPFDAVVGLMGLVHGLLGLRPLPEPPDPFTRRVEGWIWGLNLPFSPTPPETDGS